MKSFLISYEKEIRKDFFFPFCAPIFFIIYFSSSAFIWYSTPLYQSVIMRSKK